MTLEEMLVNRRSYNNIDLKLKKTKKNKKLKFKDY